MKQNNINVKEALNERDGFQVWWRLLRPHTLTASFIPVFIGSFLAYIHTDTIYFGLFFAMLFASILIQAATNMFNEYYDYKRGLDNEQSVGIGGTIVRDGIEPRTVLALAILFFSAAILLGIYICLASSWWIALIGAGSMLIGYLYTGGPIPIAYTPFGELFAGFLMGTVLIAISYFIQTLTLSGEMLLISIPIAIFIGAILLANNIRDLDNDKINGRKTIAILLGHDLAVVFLACLFIVAYGLTIYFVATDILPLWALLTLLSGIKATQVILGFKGKRTPIEMMPAMINTGKTNSIYGLLLIIAFVLSETIG